MNPREVLHFLFVVNPHSGGKAKQNWEKIITDYFNKLTHTIDFFFIEGEDCSARLKEYIRKNKPHRVIAVGGDGTITLVGKLLLGSRIALGILPAGSANGMAKELEIPLDPELALNVIVEGFTKCADVVKINDQICLHLSDIGMNAQLIKYFQEGNSRGKIGYLKVIFKVLKNRQNIQVTLDSKNLEVKRNAYMVVLANASKYGFGAVINPDGDMYDGLFEVIVIRRLAISEFFKMWFRPQAFNPNKLEIFHARSLHIETRQKVHFQVDGEYLGKVNEVNAKIMPAQINMLLPGAKKEEV